jgi:hypothetical protein
MTKRAGSGSASGSISQRQESADPDPDTDPHQNAWIRNTDFLLTLELHGRFGKCCHFEKTGSG